MGWIFGRLLLRCLCCGWEYLRAALLPKSLGDFERVYLEVVPPGLLVAGLMQLSVMAAAKRDGEFIADLHSQRSGLGEPHAMRIGRQAPADKTRLGRNKFQVGLVAQPCGFGNGQCALIDQGTRTGT
jgi:hypothetical protein